MTGAEVEINGGGGHADCLQSCMQICKQTNNGVTEIILCRTHYSVIT